MSEMTKYCNVCEHSVVGARFVRHGDGWRHTFCEPEPIEEMEGDGWYVSLEEIDGVRHLVFEGPTDYTPAMIPEDKWPDLYQFIGRLMAAPSDTRRERPDE